MRKSAVLLLGVGALLACSSSSSSNGATDGSTDGTSGTAGCGTSPCGGDVVGTWTLQTYCAPAGITAPTDTITFNADGTYSLGGGTGGGATWSTNGTNLTTGTVTGGYCVQGDTLVTVYGISKGTLVKVRTRVK